MKLRDPYNHDLRGKHLNWIQKHRNWIAMWEYRHMYILRGPCMDTSDAPQEY